MNRVFAIIGLHGYHQLGRAFVVVLQRRLSFYPFSASLMSSAQPRYELCAAYKNIIVSINRLLGAMRFCSCYVQNVRRAVGKTRAVWCRERNKPAEMEDWNYKRRYFTDIIGPSSTTVI